MQAQSAIDLPPDLYERVHRMALHRHQPVPELIADALDLTEENDTANAHNESINWAEPDEAVEREQTAYRARYIRTSGRLTRITMLLFLTVS